MKHVDNAKRKTVSDHDARCIICHVQKSAQTLKKSIKPVTRKYRKAGVSTYPQTPEPTDNTSLKAILCVMMTDTFNVSERYVEN
jgi:pentose-5-phosphate-3-epimerase